MNKILLACSLFVLFAIQQATFSAEPLSQEKSYDWQALIESATSFLQIPHVREGGTVTLTKEQLEAIAAGEIINAQTQEGQLVRVLGDAEFQRVLHILMAAPTTLSILVLGTLSCYLWQRGQSYKARLEREIKLRS